MSAKDVAFDSEMEQVYQKYLNQPALSQTQKLEKFLGQSYDEFLSAETD